jgi:ABC-type branched-subunit amino acid transport system substrate-binding protein
MKRIYKGIACAALCLLAGLALAGCGNDKEDPTEAPSAQVTWTTKKIAVVLPMGNGLDAHWQRTLQLCADNLQKAFEGNDVGIRLEYTWYDEQDADLALTAKRIAADNEVAAVIGGLSSTASQTLANALTASGKPFFTLATSEELVRGYASTQTVWAMTETDITQCEVLLSRAQYYGAKSVSLIAQDDAPYGKTFVDWFGFQAQELGLEVKEVCSYDEDGVADACQRACASEPDFILCAVENTADLHTVLSTQTDYAIEYGTAPRILFSDCGYGSDVLAELGSDAEGIEGVAYGADPESGFEVSYKVYFDDHLTRGESQVYDAAMLIGYAAYMQLLDNSLDFTTAMRTLVDGRDEGYGSWMAGNMRLVVEALKAGKHPDIQGASGSLDFDAKVYTNVLSTVYSNYKVYNGQYIILDYNSSDGSKRSSETLAGWNWKAQQMQDTDTPTADIVYPALQDRWALLVAASSGWNNYRHQADVLNMYQILKANGYTDDHIVLIAEDDIAYNASNPNPGVVQVRVGGDNVYADAHIDYHPSDLKPTDIQAILCGERSDRLPEVISAGAEDNVLVFWSGHGDYGQLVWLNDKEGFSAERAKQAFTAMSQGKHYRKVLCLIETCYSGSVMKEIEGIPGILALTAASPYETSKADIYNASMGVWMSNRFTSTLQDCLAENAAISMRDLYYRLFLNTVGSHVMLYNAAHYGNLYSSTMAEFTQGAE